METSTNGNFASFGQRVFHFVPCCLLSLNPLDLTRYDFILRIEVARSEMLHCATFPGTCLAIEVEAGNLIRDCLPWLSKIFMSDNVYCDTQFTNF